MSSKLLKEDGGALLQENGFYILLDEAFGSGAINISLIQDLIPKFSSKKISSSINTKTSGLSIDGGNEVKPSILKKDQSINIS